MTKITLSEVTVLSVVGYAEWQEKFFLVKVRLTESVQTVLRRNEHHVLRQQWQGRSSCRIRISNSKSSPVYEHHDRQQVCTTQLGR